MKGGRQRTDRRLVIGDWRLAVAPTLVFLSIALVEAATNTPASPDPIPPLRPAKPEMLPGFWEEHGLIVSIMGLIVVLVVVLLWRILRRPTPPLIPLPATVARQALQPLRERSEDATLFTEISLILRHYFVAALQLPDQEYTNRELCQELAGHARVKPTLSAAACQLLEEMEQLRFGTQASRSQRHSVELALDLIEQTEACQQPSPVEPGSTTATP